MKHDIAGNKQLLNSEVLAILAITKTHLAILWLESHIVIPVYLFFFPSDIYYATFF